MEHESAEIPLGQFENVADLLFSSTEMQISLVILIVGLTGLFTIYKKFSQWINSKKISYSRPFLSKFIKTGLLPVFAVVLVSVISSYIQFSVLTFDVAISNNSELSQEQIMDNMKNNKEIFSKLLNTINILIVGYAISRLIPVIIEKMRKTDLEKEDFEIWKEMLGFEDDHEDFFHKLFEWTPPKKVPPEMEQDDFKKMLSTKDGRNTLQQFRTSKGQIIGNFSSLVNDPLEQWKKSERKKYEEYLDDCLLNNNESGRKLRLGVIPQEVYPIDQWREQKRTNNYEKVIPGDNPPGYAAKQRQGTPKSLENAIPLLIMAGIVIGIVSWWGVDLFVLGTIVAGFGVGIGFALKETIENLFAYLMIRKDKIFVEGDRVEIDGYNGYIYKITTRVTYVKHALSESMGIFPTRQLIAAKVINYSKEMKYVPAMIEVGVSYLNNARQVVAILTKIGDRAMKEIKDEKGNHLVVQKRCPYLDDHKPSCGCDKGILVDMQQPIVRFDQFNASSLDFRLWVYVGEYRHQFKVETAMRIMIQEEFAKYDIRIPWPIRTVYQGDEKKESQEIGSLDDERNQVIEKYGSGDVQIK